MIICIHKKDTPQALADNKQQSPNLGLPVQSYKTTYLAENSKLNSNHYFAITDTG